jgi:ATP-dependent DNA helicase Q4
LKTDVEKEGKPDELGLYARIDALVTTVALAMGIDHRSIRSVIHYNMPNSLETYIQEVGRAGRNGDKAHCHLFLTEDDYYFQRARAFTDYFLDREVVSSVVRLVLGTKEDLKRIQSGEIDKDVWASIKIPQIKSKFSLTDTELLNIFKHLKEYFNEKKIEWQYSEKLDTRGMVKELKPTKLAHFTQNKLIKIIKSKSQNVKKSYCFDIIEVANIVKLNPFLMVERLKDLGLKLKFSFITDHPAFLWTRPRAEKEANFKQCFDVNGITEWLIKRNAQKIRMNTARVDALYMVLRDQAKKTITKFQDDDLVADKNTKMEKYIKLYFSYGPIDMIKKMKADGIKTDMTLEVFNSRDCHEF